MADFTDTFDTSLDTARWVTKTAGTGTVSTSGGKCVLYKPATSSVAVLVAKTDGTASGVSNTWTALVDLSEWGFDSHQHGAIALARKTSAPASGDTMNVPTYFPLEMEFYQYDAGPYGLYRFRYEKSGGGYMWYDFGSAAWSSTFDGAVDGTGSWKRFPGDASTAQYRAIIEFDASNGARFKLQNASGTTTYDTSAYVPFASLYGTGDFYAAVGAYQYAYTTAFTGTLNVDTFWQGTVPGGSPASPRRRPLGLYTR